MLYNQTKAINNGYILITSTQIQNFIEKIPPTPTVLQATIAFIDQGELIKAANAAKEDPALTHYLQVLVNKPIYGFKGEVHDISQIFGILGLSSSKQAVYNYLLSLLSPSSWEMFKLNESLFYELQATLSKKWQNILVHLNIDDKEIESAIVMMPASIIVCEALFKDNIEDVNLLRTYKDIDLSTILLKLANKSVFDISQEIARTWEMSETIIELILLSSGESTSEDETLNKLGKWMHMLLFYEFSQGVYIEAGLNDFISFNPDYVEEITEEFMELIVQ